MTLDPTKRPDAEDTADDLDAEDTADDLDAEDTAENLKLQDAAEELKPEDPTASQLFFGGHLADLVQGKAPAPPPEPEIANVFEGEKTVETPSMLFFGEHLDEAVSHAPDGGEDPPTDEG
jgi:hypothetical protein